MDRLDVIHELQSYRFLLAKIEGLSNEIESLKSYLGSIGNTIGDGMPHGTSSDSDAKYTKQVNRLVDAENELLEEYDKLMSTRDYVIQLIQLAPTRKGRDVLEMRYRYGWSVKKISEFTCRSDTNVRDLQNRSIDKILVELEKARAK